MSRYLFFFLLKLIVTIQEDFDINVKTCSNLVKNTQGNNLYLFESFFQISRCSFEVGLLWKSKAPICDNVLGHRKTIRSSLDN